MPLQPFHHRSKNASPAASPAPAPREDDVRRRAFEIYQQRSKQGSPGSAIDDWVQAERELRQRGKNAR
jgi:hypothetical protein